MLKGHFSAHLGCRGWPATLHILNDLGSGKVRTAGSRGSCTCCGRRSLTSGKEEQHPSIPGLSRKQLVRTTITANWQGSPRKGVWGPDRPTNFHHLRIGSMRSMSCVPTPSSGRTFCEASGLILGSRQAAPPGYLRNHPIDVDLPDSMETPDG